MVANLIIILFNLFSLIIALLVGEYEVAKLRHPTVAWLETPTNLDLALSAVIILITLINLSVMIFVVLRGLEFHRRWLWVTSGIGIVIIGVMVLILGTRFLSIIWPS